MTAAGSAICVGHTAGAAMQFALSDAAEQLGAEAPVNGSRLPRGPVKRTLSG